MNGSHVLPIIVLKVGHAIQSGAMLYPPTTQ
jgi:hypothetical protein